MRQTRVLKSRGTGKTSIRYVWEGVRHEHPEIGGLNDHLHSRYARAIMEENPDLDGMFYTRRLRTD